VFRFAANVNTRAMGLSDPADCGGVNVSVDAVVDVGLRADVAAPDSG